MFWYILKPLRDVLLGEIYIKKITMYFVIDIKHNQFWVESFFQVYLLS